MQKNLRINKSVSILVSIFIIDQAVLPTFHIAALPFKISYMIVALYFLNYLLKPRYFIISAYIRPKTEAKSILRQLGLLILLGVIGELILLLYTRNMNINPFYNGMKLYLFMIAGFGIGYAGHKFNKKVFLYTMYAFVLINIIMALMGSSTPSFIKILYGDYYSTGLRIRGTGGNPNATLLILNTLLLSIIALYRNNKISLSNKEVGLVIAFPLICNMFINSRGEMIQTLLLEIYFIYLLLKNDKRIVSKISKIFVSLFILLVIYLVAFNYLYHTFDIVRFSIDRISSIENITDTENVKVTSTILRPFIHLDTFFTRFIKSPIVGSGFSFGADFPFLKSADGYHNDWFRIGVTSGIIGLFIWTNFVIKAVKVGGIIMVLPFITTAISNTFIQSEKVMLLYFLIFGVLIKYYEIEQGNKLRGD